MFQFRLPIATAVAVLAAGPSLAQTGAVASGNLRVQATVLDQCVVEAPPAGRAPAAASPRTAIGVACATPLATEPARGAPVFGAEHSSASRVVSEGDRVVVYF